MFAFASCKGRCPGNNNKRHNNNIRTNSTADESQGIFNSVVRESDSHRVARGAGMGQASNEKAFKFQLPFDIFFLFRIHGFYFYPNFILYLQLFRCTRMYWKSHKYQIKFERCMLLDLYADFSNASDY